MKQGILQLHFQFKKVGSRALLHGTCADVRLDLLPKMIRLRSENSPMCARMNVGLRINGIH
jgi:hypothetical protein